MCVLYDVPLLVCFQVLCSAVATPSFLCPQVLSQVLTCETGLGPFRQDYRSPLICACLYVARENCR